jgi:exonuclease III
LCGDFNSPQIEKADGTTIPFHNRNARWRKAELSVITGLAEYDLKDVYRQLYGFKRQETSWVMRRKEKEFGRRFDHVFASEQLHPYSCTYLHSLREQGLSDHSPIEVLFDPGQSILQTNRQHCYGSGDA